MPSGGLPAGPSSNPTVVSPELLNSQTMSYTVMAYFSAAKLGVLEALPTLVRNWR